MDWHKDWNGGCAQASPNVFSLYDSSAARAYAEIAAARRAMGLSMSDADCQIAAIARVRNMAVVTRNVTDFTDTNIEVINPWMEP
ncbi:MAG: hypothetical protein OXE94_05960 [Aestuariivita sp.]|nr:hypothetical protein [Aestuariivita sp.]MCY4201481.1 hypothetical protein [Aestuariivita sp.]